MSKIIVNSEVYSENENETITNKKAILKDGVITYTANNVLVCVSILSNKVILERKNKDMELCLEFEKDKSLVTKYVIIDVGIKIKVETKTKELIIKNNSIYIKYDLFMNDEFSDSFTYKLEWSDL